MLAASYGSQSSGAGILGSSKAATAVVSDMIIRQAVARMATRPSGDQLGLHQLDGPARAERGGDDLELAAGDQAEDLVAQPRHPHVVPRFVPVQAVRHDAGRRRHVLLVLVPGALGVDGGAEAPSAQYLVVEVALGKYR